LLRPLQSPNTTSTPSPIPAMLLDPAKRRRTGSNRDESYRYYSDDDEDHEIIAPSAAARGSVTVQRDAMDSASKHGDHGSGVNLLVPIAPLGAVDSVPNGSNFLNAFYARRQLAGADDFIYLCRWCGETFAQPRRLGHLQQRHKIDDSTVEEFKQLALSDVEKLRRIVLAKVQQLGKSTMQSKLDRYIRQNGCKYEMFVNRLKIAYWIVWKELPYSTVDVAFWQMVSHSAGVRFGRSLLVDTFLVILRDLIHTVWMRRLMGGPELGGVRPVKSVSVTFDGWSNDRRGADHYLACTAHVLNDQLYPMHWVLALGRCGRNARHLADAAMEFLDKWFDDTVVVAGVVTDNAAAELAASRELADTEYTGCLAHTLQLVLAAAVRKAGSCNTAFGKCRDLATLYRSRDWRRVGQRGGAPKPVPHSTTRWNVSVVQARGVLDVLQWLRSDTEETDEDAFLLIDELKEVLEFLDPLVHLTEVCQSSEHVTMPCVVPWLLALQGAWTADRPSLTGGARAMRCALLEEFDDRFDGWLRVVGRNERFFELYPVPSVQLRACALHPALWSHVRQRDRDAVWSQIEASADHVCQNVGFGVAGLKALRCALESCTKSLVMDLSTAKGWERFMLNANDEMRSFYCDGKTSGDPIPDGCLSSVMDVVKMYFSLPATQTESERAFSAAKRVVTEKRTLLLDANMELNVTLKSMMRVDSGGGQRFGVTVEDVLAEAKTMRLAGIRQLVGDMNENFIELLQ
jgi:hypothetical protein